MKTNRHSNKRFGQSSSITTVAQKLNTRQHGLDHSDYLTHSDDTVQQQHSLTRHGQTTTPPSNLFRPRHVANNQHQLAQLHGTAQPSTHTLKPDICNLEITSAHQGDQHSKQLRFGGSDATLESNLTSFWINKWLNNRNHTSNNSQESQEMPLTQAQLTQPQSELRLTQKSNPMSQQVGITLPRCEHSAWTTIIKTALSQHSNSRTVNELPWQHIRMITIIMLSHNETTITLQTQERHTTQTQGIKQINMNASSAISAMASMSPQSLCTPLVTKWKHTEVNKPFDPWLN